MQVQQRFSALALRVEHLLRLRPFVHVCDVGLAGKADIVARCKRLMAFEPPTSGSCRARGPCGEEAAWAQPAAPPTSATGTRCGDVVARLDKEQGAVLEELGGVLLPAMRVAQQRALSCLAAATAAGGADTLSRAVEECKPFFELFRLAQWALVDPHSPGITVVCSNGAVPP